MVCLVQGLPPGFLSEARVRKVEAPRVGPGVLLPVGVGSQSGFEVLAGIGAGVREVSAPPLGRELREAQEIVLMRGVCVS